MSGFDVLPLVEGGKGVSVSNGRSAGAFAAAGCVGTFSCVNADSYDENGKAIPKSIMRRLAACATRNWSPTPSRAV